MPDPEDTEKKAAATVSVQPPMLKRLDGWSVQFELVDRDLDNAQIVHPFLDLDLKPV
jgi:hypothetical protein